MPIPNPSQKGRGATINPDNRYSAVNREDIDDGWDNLEEPVPSLQTTLSKDTSRRIITYNNSPDVGFDRSINPYRGCEHGCVYCFARPTHAWLDLSPGLDFESRLFYKPDAVKLLTSELAHPKYQCAPVAVGINTDAYQPIERKLQLTRSILNVLVATQHPFSIVTKSSLIERDIDLLAKAASNHQAAIAVSITSLDRSLARHMEPRAAAPQRRLEIIRRLSDAGIPVTVLVAPLIPALTDTELETILEQARQVGAQHAGYILIRLPHELKDMFQDWLYTHEPLKAKHVLNQIREMRGGQLYDNRFGVRMRGTGEYASIIQKRFNLAYKRLGFLSAPALDISCFKPPVKSPQFSLF